jgi:SAM-dependent methyltransferase
MKSVFDKLNPRREVLAGIIVVAAASAWLCAPETVWAALLLGASALLLACVAPVWALVLLAWIAPLEQARELEIWGTVYTTEILLVACLVGGFWNVFRIRAWQHALVPVKTWILPFVAIVLASACLTGTAIAWKGALRWMEFILVLMLGVHLLRRGREAERILWALVLAAMFSAWQGLTQTCSAAAAHPELTRMIIGQVEVTRAAAGFGANTLAVFLALMLPFTAGAALFHGQGLARLAGLIGCGLLTAGFLATFSFTGIMAVGVAIAVVFILFWLENYSHRIKLLVLLLLGFLLLAGLYSEVLSCSFWKIKLASWQNRLEYARVAGRLFQQAPWLGIGPGMYRFLAPAMANGNVNPIGFITHPHMLWLSVLAETGILGLTALFWAGWQGAIYMVKKAQHLEPGWPAAGAWAMMAGLAGFAMANLTEHCLIHDRGVHAALALAATLVWVRRPPRPRRPEPRGVFERAWQKEFKPLFSEKSTGLQTAVRKRGIEAQPDWRKIMQERVQGRARFYELLEKALADKSDKVEVKILELGCGPALDALWLAAKPGRQIHAVDNSARAIHLAASAAHALQRSLSLHRADVRRTGLPDQAFDLVFSQGLLEHFPDPIPVWKESVRLLKPGGYLVVDVPQALNPYTLIKLWHQWRGNWPWGWETQYTLGGLRMAAQRHGLRLAAARGYGYWGGVFDPTSWLKNICEPRFPRAWQTWERTTGAWWMMNVAGLFRK